MLHSVSSLDSTKRHARGRSEPIFHGSVGNDRYASYPWKQSWMLAMSFN
jgi:hypothetical protein